MLSLEKKEELLKKTREAYHKRKKTRSHLITEDSSGIFSELNVTTNRTPHATGIYIREPELEVIRQPMSNLLDKGKAPVTFHSSSYIENSSNIWSELNITTNCTSHATGIYIREPEVEVVHQPISHLLDTGKASVIFQSSSYIGSKPSDENAKITSNITINKDTMEYTCIKDINPNTRGHWTANVRVIEKSFPRIPQTNTKPYQRLILVDTEGTRVQATIFGNDIDFLSHTLQLLHHYQVSNAVVTAVEGRFRIVPHMYQWTINRRTALNELMPDTKSEISIPLNLVKFYDLPKYIDAQSQVDILAVVISSLPQKEVQTAFNKSKVQEFIIINEELKPTIITLWDQFVSNEATCIVTLIHKWPIILAMRLKVGSYNGMSLSTKSSSTFVMDPNIPEAVTLRSWTTQHQKIIEDIVATKQYKSASVTSTSKSIGDVIQIKDIHPTPQTDETFKVCAYSLIVNKQQKFYYMSCNKCHKSIDAKYELAFTCNYCNKTAIATPRCCIEIQLEDSSGQLKGTIFGQKAEDLLSLTAIKLLENTSESGTVDIKYLDTATSMEKHIFLLKSSYHQHHKDKVVRFVVMSVYDAPATEEN